MNGQSQNEVARFSLGCLRKGCGILDRLECELVKNWIASRLSDTELNQGSSWIQLKLYKKASLYFPPLKSSRIAEVSVDASLNLLQSSWADFFARSWSGFEIGNGLRCREGGGLRRLGRILFSGTHVSHGRIRPRELELGG